MRGTAITPLTIHHPMRPSDLNRLVSRRAVVFGGVQAVAGVALVARLFQLQFIHGAEFVTLAEGNRAKLQLIIPPRGVITDRHGVALAANHPNLRLMLSGDDRKAARASLKVLAPLLALTDRELRTLTGAINIAKPGIPILVREHLAWEDVARIEYHLPELAAVAIDEGQWRHYPFADHSSHLIGYVGKVSPEEVKEDEPLTKLPDMKIGKNGIESLYDMRLRGEAGARQMEVNANGSPVRELKREDPKPAEALKLTIDNRLQEFCVERLGEESGAAVVMNVHTGEILALVSVPAFDPNQFSKGIPAAYWRELNENKKAPLLNKAIAGQYPPGSTFKMVTGLAGLHSGKFNAQSRIHCSGTFYLGSKPFRCWKKEGHGTLDMAGAIEQSCDTYFYTVGREVGIDAIAEMSYALGLGAKSGLGLRGEQPGIVPSPAWKQKVGRGEWNPGETINSSIGQGDTLTTPLQLAIMTARMVNGGKKILPHLVVGEDVKNEGDIDLAPEHLAVIREGMDRVTNAPRGTAFGSTIKEEKYKFGGKTGTSQVRKLLVQGQNQNELPWEFRHHAWFVGYAPIHAPEIACAVIIEHGGGGASAAAPVVRDILLKAQQLADGTADGTAPNAEEHHT